MQSIYGNSPKRVADESFTGRSRGSEHRTVLITFSTDGQTGAMELRSSWKDHQVNFFEALKIVSADAKMATERTASPVTGSSTDQEVALKGVAALFETFVSKFSASYFSCTNRSGGYFMWNEPESILVFVLSNSKTRLETLNRALVPSWQRKNIFVQFHPEGFEFPTDRSESYFPFFPVPSMRHADQLAFTMHRANTIECFDSPHMELLGKGGWVQVKTAAGSDDADSQSIGLMQSRFAGHPKWPLPTGLTEQNWRVDMPVLVAEAVGRFNMAELPVEFDEYAAYIPNLHARLNDASGVFILHVETERGRFPLGVCERFAPASPEAAASLLRVLIGPINFPGLLPVMRGEKESLLSYMQTVPPFYESFLRSCMGELKWNRLWREMPRNWHNSFPMPAGFSDVRDRLRHSQRQKAKVELAATVERTDGLHRQRSHNRLLRHQPQLFPSLQQMQRDERQLSRLKSRFHLALDVFVASCDERTGTSLAYSNNQLPTVLFRHCLSTQQMTDYSEMMRKKRPLRPLFTENERDLFHLLKQKPELTEEMCAAHFVSGDIFGNPFKRERRERPRRRLESVPELKPSESTDECPPPHETQMPPSPAKTLSVIDEIDYQEMEDVENEIVMDGTVVHPVSPPDLYVSVPPSPGVDWTIVRSLIRSPGGQDARLQLQETLQLITDALDFEGLLELCRRFKRHHLAAMITTRIAELSF